MKKIQRTIGVWLTALIVLVAYAASGCSLFRHKSDPIYPHLIAEAQAEQTPVRPVDLRTETVAVTGADAVAQFNELSQILYSGAKPDLSDALPAVKETYDAAIAVLNRYVRNDFTDFERVHAIHDWIVYTTAYDFDLLNGAANAQNPSFTPEGVLLHGKAVCDGYSRAFMLLCGIEGIRSIRITGVYSQEGRDENHAWNKVCLGGVWYNVDTTMDVWHAYLDASTRIDSINHGYFLVSDAAMRSEPVGLHTESGNDNPNYACSDDYDFYGVTPLGIGTYTMELRSQQELNDVFTAVKKSNGKKGRIELKLNFPEYDPSNLRRPDAYAAQIAEAYALVSSDFSMNPSAGEYPYRRYPNGVFVFLIYK